MHDCVIGKDCLALFTISLGRFCTVFYVMAALKRPIVETIETERDRAFAARREKKAEEAKKKGNTI